MIDGLDVEIVSWSLRASSRVAPPSAVAVTGKSRAAKVSSQRRMFDSQLGQFQQGAVVARQDLQPGDWVAGPAVITERETSTIITASREVIMQADGCLLLRAKQA
ncbi:hypothetical protein D3C79_802660 [compost metagenome]